MSGPSPYTHVRASPSCLENRGSRRRLNDVRARMKRDTSWEQDWKYESKLNPPLLALCVCVCVTSPLDLIRWSWVGNGVSALFSRLSCVFGGLGSRLGQNPLHHRKAACHQAASAQRQSHAGTATLWLRQIWVRRRLFQTTVLFFQSQTSNCCHQT